MANEIFAVRAESGAVLFVTVSRNHAQIKHNEWEYLGIKTTVEQLSDEQIQRYIDNGAGAL